MENFSFLKKQFLNPPLAHPTNIPEYLLKTEEATETNCVVRTFMAHASVT